VLTHAHGFVVRDDRRGEIVVAFRGSHELADMVTGTHFVPPPPFYGLRLLRVLLYEAAVPHLSPSARSCVIICGVFADGNLVLIPLVSHGIEKNNTALVHAGFLVSYNSVRAVVVHVVRDQLLAFPNYTVVISGSYLLYSVPPFRLTNGVGHSLGGALASIAALSVKSNIPSAIVRLFTYGVLFE
jgi:hypothetical protein